MTRARRAKAIGLTCAASVVCCVGVFAVLAGDAAHAPPDSEMHRFVLDIGPGPMPPRRHPPSKAEASVASFSEQEIVQCIEADMQALGAPGAAATVRLEGEVVFDRGFGFKRRGQPALVDSETRFRIGSITKIWTAAAVMQQIEAGLVGLDEPVTGLIPEMRLRGRWQADLITPRHLLTHTAAMPDFYEDPLGPTGPSALGEWAATLANVHLHAPPGTFWNYSNPGFALAGLVAERASGVAYRDLIETRIFDPVGMNASTFDPAEVAASGNFAYGHFPESNGGETVYAPDAYDSWVASPSGLAFSTASDLALWGQAMLDEGGTVLSRASARAMQERQMSLDYIPGYHYGFGVFAENYNGLEVRHHGGNLTGWGAFLLWVPEGELVVAIVGNTHMHLTAAAFCIVDAVLEPEPSPPEDWSTDPDTWGRYAGTYHFLDNRGNPFVAEITKTGERFFITFNEPGDPEYYRTDLVQQYLDTFVIDFDGDQILDPLFDLTFIRRRAPQSATMWLRNRSFVGRRVLPPHRPGGRLAPQ